MKRANSYTHLAILVLSGAFVLLSSVGGVYADVSWDNTISPSYPGTDYWIHSSAVFEGKLVVGGLFSIAGGVPARSIAQWNGEEWEAMGPGLGEGQWVHALIVFHDTLFAGGSFGVRKWDRHNWVNVGWGFDFEVNCLCVHNGHLIAGGSFTTASGTPMHGISSWNGVSWNPLGIGMWDSAYQYPEVSSVTSYKGKLIAGGKFISAGGQKAYGIAA